MGAKSMRPAKPFAVAGSMRACGMLAMLALAGCQTPYEESYSDFRINETVFSVTARGNQYTPEEVVEKYLFRRASEITLHNGFKYFEFISHQDRTRVGSYYSSSGHSSTYGTGYGVYSHGSGSSVAVPIIEPGQTVWINCYESRPDSAGVVVDAAGFLAQNFPEEYEEFQEKIADQSRSPASRPVK